MDLSRLSHMAMAGARPENPALLVLERARKKAAEQQEVANKRAKMADEIKEMERPKCGPEMLVKRR